MFNTNNTSGLSEAEYIQIAHNLRAVNFYSVASLVMLFYDIVITFGDEVEQIWKREFTKFTPLWFLNRYLSPLGLIVITVSSLDPKWINGACDRYVFFPEILRLFTSGTIGIIFIMRLYATYSRSFIVAVSMTCLLLMELTLKIWSFTSGQSLQLPPGLVGCVLTTGSDSLRFTFTWIAELIFDSVVFILTLWKTFSLNHMMGGGTRSLLDIIIRDGVIYFTIIFAANLVNVLIFLLAPPNLKAINASFTVAITPLMVSRLILNLRTAGKASIIPSTEFPAGLQQNYIGGKDIESTRIDFSQIQFATRASMGDKDFELRIIGGPRTKKINALPPLLSTDNFPYIDFYRS